MSSRIGALIMCCCLILILSNILILSSTGLGVSTFSSQSKTEALLAIVAKANDTVSEVLSDLRMLGVHIPEEVLLLHTQCLAKVDAAFSLYQFGNYHEADQRAVEALQTFKTVLIMIYNQPQDPVTHDEALNEIIIQYNNSIHRISQYLEYIETLIPSLESNGYNTTRIEDAIQSAKVLAEKALRELHQNRFRDTNNTLSAAKTLMNTLMEHIHAIAKDWKVRKLETFIVDTEKRLNLIEDKISSLSSEISPEVKNASLTALEEAENKLDNARNYLQIQMVDETVNELAKSKALEEEALLIISTNQTSPSDNSELEDVSTEIQAP